MNGFVSWGCLGLMMMLLLYNLYIIDMRRMILFLGIVLGCGLISFIYTNMCSDRMTICGFAVGKKGAAEKVVQPNGEEGDLQSSFEPSTVTVAERAVNYPSV